ncbi:MAG: YggU family protein [Deltaproteobacteria bacterium]|nr:YggU family protein [Deltaproteobacteria bacterium]
MNYPPYLLQEKTGTCLLQVWVQPNAKRSDWAGLYGQRIKIRLAAPAVNGKANKELIRFLSQELGLAKKDIEISAGLRVRGKTIRIVAEVDSLLAHLPLSSFHRHD